MTRPEPELGLVVTSRAAVADGVITLDLRDPGGATLPGWSPGAHIDLLLGCGLTRQFSLCGDPADRARWRIAVLREPGGRGGSAYVHDAVVEGSLVRARGPRNHFRLEPADRYLFIAGGIGITPILPMLAAADTDGRPWALTYGGRTGASMAFRADLLARYPGRVRIRPRTRPACSTWPASSTACSPARWCTAAGPRRCWMRWRITAPGGPPGCCTSSGSPRWPPALRPGRASRLSLPGRG
jgi:ferredoxin-NADP reductase